MKEKFFGYIPYNSEAFKKLWDSAVFVVDANILLNLYRYSKETQEQVIKCLKRISDRLWIPYNVAKEYFDNRINVIYQQEKIYEDIKSKINFGPIKNEIEGVRHLTLDSKKEQLIAILDKCEDDIKKVIDDDKSNSKSFVENDDVLNSILDLFDGKVGQEKSESEIDSLKKEIDKRYEKCIPPGFKDSKKIEDRKYGDCINWFEIINYSKNNKKDIIFITDDTKSDWILKIDGKNIGPKSELLDEFHKRTEGRIIYIYTTKGFLQNFNKYIDAKLPTSQNVYNEIDNLMNNLYKINKNYYSKELKDTLINKFIYECSKEDLNNQLIYNYFINNLSYSLLESKKVDNEKVALEIDDMISKLDGSLDETLPIFQGKIEKIAQKYDISVVEALKIYLNWKAQQ